MEDRGYRHGAQTRVIRLERGADGTRVRDVVTEVNAVVDARKHEIEVIADPVDRVPYAVRGRGVDGDAHFFFGSEFARRFFDFVFALLNDRFGIVRFVFRVAERVVLGRRSQVVKFV